LFFLSIGLLLVWLAVRGKSDEEIANIKKSFNEANYFWIIVAMVVSGLSHYFRAVRWKLLLQPLNYKPKTSNTFFAVMVGYLANFALPRLGEVSRCALLNKYENVPFTQGFGTVIVERAFDFVCLLLIFFFILLLEFGKIYGIADQLIFQTVMHKTAALMQHKTVLLLLLAFGVIVIIALFYFRKKIAELISGKLFSFLLGIWEGLKSIRNLEKPAMFLVHTILIWIMYILQVYICFWAFTETNSLTFATATVIVVFGSIGIIAVPGGTGAYQVILIQILTTAYFISEATSFAFAWVVWSAQFLLILLLGIFSLLMLALLNKSKTEKERE
jgi:uncharacterized protein (TIRG00374 family)